jgi:predicted DNA-binding transcriptional regulator AlpA
MSRQIIDHTKLPDMQYIRQAQLIPHILPFSAATLWRKVKLGTFPQPIRLSERITCWSVASIREWLEDRAEK